MANANLIGHLGANSLQLLQPEPSCCFLSSFHVAKTPHSAKTCATFSGVALRRIFSGGISHYIHRVDFVMNDHGHILNRHCKWPLMAFAVFAIALISGCANLRLPRIDPSGNSIFLPAPNSTGLIRSGQTNGNSFGSGQSFNQAAPIGLPQIGQPMPSGGFAGNNFATVPATNSPAVAAQNLAPTLPTANTPNRNPYRNASGPAFTQPPVPPPCDGSDRTSRRKHLIPDPNRKLSPGQAGEMMMTPSRIVAPVGSEVVVLAGICGGDGFLVKNQPLEWMLSNDSVGEFIEIGGMHHSTFNKLIPPSSKKINGQYAWGRTGLKPQIISRGTPTPLDDIELRTGQTFVSVSSASPGTSYVTGVAPKAEGWDRRKATTVIHWVDGNWSIPTPTRATAGTVTPLTTVISGSEGRGLSNWPVRYTIVGGAPAEFAPAGSSTAEVKSDTNGQATVQIRQPAGQFEPGQTQVRVDVVRPPVYGQPELIVESGITTVDWNAPALTIRAIGPRATEQGTPFNYRIEVSNPGDQVARNVVVRTKDLDDSIEFISSNPKPTEYGRQYEWRIGDVAPGANPQIVDMQLKSEKLGNVGLCFEVASNEDRLQTEACAQTEIVQPCINLVIDGPSTVRVGDQVNFLMRVENRCDQPLENIEMTINYDPGLVRPGKSNPAKVRFDDNGVLQVNQSETFPFVAIAQGTGQQCLNVTITADGVRPERQTACVTVGPADGTPISGSPFPGNSSDALSLKVSGGDPFTSTGADGSTETLSKVTVEVNNRGTQPIENATLFARASDALEAVSMTESLRANLRQSQDGNELIVGLPTINPGQPMIVEFGYASNRNDPEANVIVSLESPQTRSANQRIGVSTVPRNGPADDTIRNPDFRNGSGIGIPNDPAVGSSDVSNQDVANIDAEFARRTATPGETIDYSFSVTNNTNQTLDNVDISFLVPNSLSLENVRSAENYRLQSPDRLQTIVRLQPRQRLDFVAEVKTGNIRGPATLEVKMQSGQTPLSITARDQIVIN